MDTYNAIAPGFGARLKQERERLGLSQDAFATAVGIKRLAQHRYEKEKYVPTIRYLADAGKIGVELVYLLFGVHPQNVLLSTDKIAKIEKRIFEVIEEYAIRSCGGNMSADARYVLFDVMRKQLLAMGEEADKFKDKDLVKIVTNQT